MRRFSIFALAVLVVQWPKIVAACTCSRDVSFALVSIHPSDGATGLPLKTRVQGVPQDLNPAMTGWFANRFRLVGPSGVVATRVERLFSRFDLVPDVPLAPNTTYTIEERVEFDRAGVRVRRADSACLAEAALKLAYEPRWTPHAKFTTRKSDKTPTLAVPEIVSAEYSTKYRDASACGGGSWVKVKVKGRKLAFERIVDLEVDGQVVDSVSINYDRDFELRASDSLCDPKRMRTFDPRYVPRVRLIETGPTGQRQVVKPKLEQRRGPPPTLGERPKSKPRVSGWLSARSSTAGVSRAYLVEHPAFEISGEGLAGWQSSLRKHGAVGPLRWRRRDVTVIMNEDQPPLAFFTYPELAVLDADGYVKRKHRLAEGHLREAAISDKKIAVLFNKPPKLMATVFESQTLRPLETLEVAKGGFMTGRIIVRDGRFIVLSLNEDGGPIYVGELGAPARKVGSTKGLRYLGAAADRFLLITKDDKFITVPASGPAVTVELPFHASAVGLDGDDALFYVGAGHFGSPWFRKQSSGCRNAAMGVRRLSNGNFGPVRRLMGARSIESATFVTAQGPAMMYVVPHLGQPRIQRVGR